MTVKGSHPKVLLVDDLEANLRALQTILKELPLEIYKAKSGSEGLRMVLNHAFALVLLDVQMPEMSGYEMASILHQNPAYRHIPIIFITANDPTEINKLSGYAVGAVDYLFKPLNREVLLSKVQVFIELDRKQRKLEEEMAQRRLIMDELQSHKMHLEELVAQRTAELEQSNARLRQEVADRTKAEQQTKISLEANEALLQEIHHRVKNNLQVVAGLLYLQSTEIEDPDMLDIFIDSNNRIHSMALVHETLYQTHNFAQVEFGEYAQNLVNLLVQSYQLPNVTVRPPRGTATVPLAAAAPCGLILNELISNAMKHAFPNSRSGTIDITVETNADDGSFSFVIEDDGVGLPAGWDPANSRSLGVRLVKRLVSQVRGSVTFTSSQGTCVTVRIPPFSKRS